MFNPYKIIELENERKAKDKKFTVSKLLKFVDITAPAYTAIKEGKSMPRVSILHKIAVFYDVDMNYFFTDMKSIEKETYKITDATTEFLVNRIENQAIRITELETQVRMNEARNKQYSMQDVQDNQAAEPTAKLTKTTQPHTKNS